MRQKVKDIRGKIVNESLAVADFCVDGDNLWATSVNYNYLFKIELKRGVVVEAIPLPFGRPFDLESVAFIFLDNQWIYVIPRDNSYCICKVDKNNNAVDELENFLPNEKWGRGTACDNQYLFVPVSDKNEFLKIDMRKLHYERIVVPDNINGIEAIAKNGNEYWLIETNTWELLNYSMDLNCVKCYSDRPKSNKFYPGGPIYCSVIGTNNPIMFPRYANQILRLTDEKVLERVGDVFDEYEFKESLFFSAHPIGNRIFSFLHGYNCWNLYDSEMNLIEQKKIDFSPNVVEKISLANPFKENGNYLKSNYIDVEDNALFSLKSFIEGLFA